MNFIRKLFYNKKIIAELYNYNESYRYNILMNLDETLYPEYLKYVYKKILGVDLNLKHPKTFTEKIQWLKLYDNKLIKSVLTDKFLVRDWIKEQIGEEYLKPIFQVCDTFDEINFRLLPECFVIKCNHGCKWHFIVKNKMNFLENEVLFNMIKKRINFWISKSFFGFTNFEIQYKNIKPKILVEKLLCENIDELPEEIEVYCFNGNPKIIEKHYGNAPVCTVWDESYNNLNLRFKNNIEIRNSNPNELVELAVKLSKKLCQQFKLVRCDYIIYNKRLYFNELTFTPRSGFIFFPSDCVEWNIKLGKMLELKDE